MVLRIPGIVVNGLLNLISFNAISRTVFALGTSVAVPSVSVFVGSNKLLIGIIDEMVIE